MSNMERVLGELKALRKELSGVMEFVSKLPDGSTELKEMARVLVQPIALKVEDAARAISLGPTKFAELVKAKQIATFTVGRRRLVRVAELERWAEAQSTPVSVRYPRPNGRSEKDKLLASLKRKR